MIHWLVMILNTTIALLYFSSVRFPVMKNVFTWIIIFITAFLSSAFGLFLSPFVNTYILIQIGIDFIFSFITTALGVITMVSIIKKTYQE